VSNSVTCFCVQISNVPEDGGNGSSQPDRETLLQHRADEMFRVETSKTLCEEIVVGEVPQARIQEAGAPQGEHSLLSEARWCYGSHFCYSNFTDASEV
jgi:hypothetical protein